MNIHIGTMIGAGLALAIIILLAVSSLTRPDLGCVTDTECNCINCLDY